MMKAPTKTQLQIAQELGRRDCQPMKTTQDEYLKFSVPSCWGCSGGILWVGRRGDLRIGRRLKGSSRVVSGSVWRGLVQAAKANYREENDKK